MCLDTIDDTKPEPCGVGFKILRQDWNYRRQRSKLIAGTMGFSLYTELRTNRWSKAVGQTNLHEYELCYPAGFHIFPTMGDCVRFMKDYGWKGYPIYRVEYKGAHTQGTQYYGNPINRCKVIVAKYIRVLPHQGKGVSCDEARESILSNPSS